MRTLTTGAALAAAIPDTFSSRPLRVSRGFLACTGVLAALSTMAVPDPSVAHGVVDQQQTVNSTCLPLDVSYSNIALQSFTPAESTIVAMDFYFEISAPVTLEFLIGSSACPGSITPVSSQVSVPVTAG